MTKPRFCSEENFKVMDFAYIRSIDRNSGEFLLVPAIKAVLNSKQYLKAEKNFRNAPTTAYNT